MSAPTANADLDRKRAHRRHANNAEPLSGSSTEHEKRDSRSRFQHDRDRVLYSAAFRRLSGVGQVVHTGEHSFHNRLIHSLKVAQVGRRLAENILRKVDSAVLDALGGLDADVVETAALCHDLGHPPFGHAAESELQACFKKASIPDGFEGNAQSFRIVTKVARRESHCLGLDLTAASRCAILKYPWERTGDEDTHHSRKFGYFNSEEEDFQGARSFLPGNDERKSLEAEVMEWADDVTYAVHDVEDAFCAGLVPLDQLLGPDDKLNRNGERERYIEWLLDFRIHQKAKEGRNKKSRRSAKQPTTTWTTSAHYFRTS